MDIAKILSNAGVSPRPSYYSGRGATLSDLDSEKLMKIQAGIKSHHGEIAAASFLKMVQSMEELNATDFIKNCFTLEDNGFKWDFEKPVKSGFDVDKDENGIHNEAQAVATVLSALDRGRRDQTEKIRERFLQINGIPPKHWFAHKKPRRK